MREKRNLCLESFGIKGRINSDVILSIVEGDTTKFMASTEKGIPALIPTPKTFRNYGNMTDYRLFDEETKALKLV